MRTQPPPFRSFRSPKRASNLFLGLFSLCEGRGLVERVAGDGQEDVEQGVISAQGQQHEVQGVDHPAALAAALRVDGRVHHLVPILSSQNL